MISITSNNFPPSLRVSRTPLAPQARAPGAQGRQFATSCQKQWISAAVGFVLYQCGAGWRARAPANGSAPLCQRHPISGVRPQAARRLAICIHRHCTDMNQWRDRCLLFFGRACDKLRRIALILTRFQGERVTARTNTPMYEGRSKSAVSADQMAAQYQKSKFSVNVFLNENYSRDDQ